MYTAEEEKVAHVALARTWSKSRGGVGFPSTKVDQQEPQVVYHLDFRFS